MAPKACGASTRPAGSPSCRTRTKRKSGPCPTPPSARTHPITCCHCATSARFSCDWIPPMPIDVESKLLIVDDLPENLLALEALLRGPARRVFQATSAERALGLLLEHEFALAILDVQMPDMNGFELAEMMRSTERTRHIPIIFVSAAGREMNYAFKGYESGAVDFLHKPLDAHAVNSKVSVFVDLYRHRKALRHEMD